MKNISTRSRDRIHFLQKNDLKFIVRVSCIYIVTMIATASVLVASPSIGQGLDQEVTIGMNHGSIRDLIEKVEAVSDVILQYRSEVVEKYTDISFAPKQRTVRETLELALEATDLKFDVYGKYVVIYAKGDDRADTGQVLPEKRPEPAIKPIQVSGTVKDKDGEPLPGVNVVVKGTTVGTATDASGNFVVDVPEGSDALVFSFIGFKTVEVSLNGRTTFEVEMETDVTTLEAVEIKGGYYTTTDRLKTGSIVKVTSKEIENQPVTSPLMALQGRVPGLDITPTSGAPGSAVKIQIRGRNSLRNNSRNETVNSPLYVIDGVPLDPSPLRSATNTLTTVYEGYDPLSTINPSNIESIEVLKDADATSIYGSRGANGVILITTKRGNRTGKTNFDVNVYSGFGKVTNQMDLLNADQYLMMRREAFANDNATPGQGDFDLNGAWDTTRNTNWQRELLGHTATVNDIRAGLSGGNDRTSFTFNVGYHDETAVYPGDFGSHLYTGQFSLNHGSDDGRFRSSLTFNYGSRKSTTFESSTFVAQALQLSPSAPAIYKDDGSLNWQVIGEGDTRMSTFDNPLAKLNNTNEMSEGNLIVNGNVEYEIIRNLFLRANLGYTELTGEEHIKMPLSAQDPIYVSWGATASAMFGLNRRKSLLIEPQMVYKREFNGHSFDAILGGTWQRSESIYQHTVGSGYTSDFLLNSMQAATTVYTAADVLNEFKYLSIFARVGYNFREKYLASVTGRRDGSSRFGPGNRFGNFGSIGVGWLFSNENQIKDNLRFLSHGKIRGSYGITGNDQIGDYRYMDSYVLSGYRYNNAATLTPSALYNPGFSWEETTKLEAALELGFFDDFVFLEAGWYRNRSASQLVDYALPWMSGFQSVFRNFPATVQNSGLEAILRIRAIRKEKVNLVTSLNISTNRNELVDFPGIETSSYNLQYKVGETLNQTLLLSYKGVNPETGSYEVNDIDGDDNITLEDFRLMAVGDRKYFGGLSNTLTLGGFELGFTFQFSKQRKLGYRMASPAGTFNRNMPADVLRRWRQEGDETDVQRFSQNYSTALGTAFFNASDGAIVDGSFIRLKTVSLSYTLPGKWLDAVSLKQARIFAQAQNVFTITKYNGLDPETELSLPPLQMYSLGLSLRF